MPPRKKAKKAKKEPPPDWRSPIFYWRGTISGVSDNVWSGTWVASENGLPADAEFDASNTTFRLESKTPLGPDAAGEFTGKYKLDQGDGLQDFEDVYHNIAVSASLCAARGNTEFGEFVSLGKFVRAADGTLTLTLARRYIGDRDPRRKQTAEGVLGRIQAGGPDAGHCETPWTALPWRVAADFLTAVPEPAAAAMDAEPEPEAGAKIAWRAAAAWSPVIDLIAWRAAAA